MVPSEALREALRNHEHSFFTIPGRCVICGVDSEELRRRDEHNMLVAAFDRLAAVLEKVEAKL